MPLLVPSHVTDTRGAAPAGCSCCCSRCCTAGDGAGAPTVLPGGAARASAAAASGGCCRSSAGASACTSCACCRRRSHQPSRRSTRSALRPSVGSCRRLHSARSSATGSLLTAVFLGLPPSATRRANSEASPPSAAAPSPAAAARTGARGVGAAAARRRRRRVGGAQERHAVGLHARQVGVQHHAGGHQVALGRASAPCKRASPSPTHTLGQGCRAAFVRQCCRLPSRRQQWMRGRRPQASGSRSLSRAALAMACGAVRCAAQCRHGIAFAENAGKGSQQALRWPPYGHLSSRAPALLPAHCSQDRP